MRWRRRVSADIDHAIGNVGWSKPPALAACPRPAPGQGPGAGTAALPEHAVHQEATAHPPVASPGTGLYGRETMRVRFFDTGITVTDDHVRRRTLIDVPPADEWGVNEACPGCGRPSGIWCEPGCPYGKDGE